MHGDDFQQAIINIFTHKYLLSWKHLFELPAIIVSRKIKTDTKNWSMLGTGENILPLSSRGDI
jgi:hypothetical protein